MYYEYLPAGDKTRIKKITSANFATEDFSCDALGRLTLAKGGANLWQQQYGYDRFGNRTTVSQSGVAADCSPIPRDGHQSLSYEASSNRLNTESGFEYDNAGNQTRALSSDGLQWLRFEYDANKKRR